MLKVSLGDPIDESLARDLAKQLLTYSCDGLKCRPEKGDPVYDAVTEDRDCGDVYSSCGDLGHWLLYRLGVRLGIVNRKEHLGWARGQNISKLAWCRYAKTPTRKDTFGCGDIIIIWNKPEGTDAHLMCVLEDVTTGTIRRITVANYGQPGGKISTPKVFYVKLGTSERIILGDRIIQKWIPLMSVLGDAKKQDKLVEAEDPTRAEDGSSIWTC